MAQLTHSKFKAENHHGKHISLLLDSVTDPLNVGAAFRLGEAMGVNTLFLCGETPHPPHARIKKTGRGAEKRLSWKTGQTLEIVKELKDQGFFCAGIEITDDSVNLSEFEFPNQPICLIVGNENNGLSDKCIKSCHQILHIPMFGVISSLNVTSALSIALWQSIIR